MNTSYLELPSTIKEVIASYGFTLDTLQPHILGERFLMRSITTNSGHKWVLLGTRTADQVRVVIKISTDTGGKRELRHERICRTVLQKIRFAYEVFSLPEELLFTEHNNVLIAVHRFIEQDKPFLSRPLPEQFSFALHAFKAQESAHASTYEHEQLVARTFGARWSKTYLHNFTRFIETITKESTPRGEDTLLLKRALTFLQEHTDVIDQYGGFLTHTDFVPHNFRIADRRMYLLDASSLRFGNKYEGWARFLNFMTLHNPPLAELLTEYVHANRTPEESLSLRAMRIYRLGEIWAYYAGTLRYSQGDLLTLNRARTVFWSSVLSAVLKEESVQLRTIEQYTHLRDSLRSTEEKRRQENLH